MSKHLSTLATGDGPITSSLYCRCLMSLFLLTFYIRTRRLYLVYRSCLTLLHSLLLHTGMNHRTRLRARVCVCVKIYVACKKCSTKNSECGNMLTTSAGRFNLNRSPSTRQTNFAGNQGYYLLNSVSFIYN